MAIFFKIKKSFVVCLMKGISFGLSLLIVGLPFCVPWPCRVGGER